EHFGVFARGHGCSFRKKGAARAARWAYQLRRLAPCALPLPISWAYGRNYKGLPAASLSGMFNRLDSVGPAGGHFRAVTVIYSRPGDAAFTIARIELLAGYTRHAATDSWPKLPIRRPRKR